MLYYFGKQVYMKFIVKPNNKPFSTVCLGFYHTTRVMLPVLGDWWVGGSMAFRGLGAVGYVAAASTEVC